MSANRSENMQQAEERWANNRLQRRKQYTPTSYMESRDQGTTDAQIGVPIDLTQFTPDPKTIPHHESAPATSFQVLRNLVQTARALGVQSIDIDTIEQVCDNLLGRGTQ